MFLEWWVEVKAYRHVHGAETLRVVEGRLQPISRWYEHLQNRDAAEFISELRRIADNAHAQ